jgi:hypothetical protein
MSRFTDLFQPKPVALSVEEKKVDSKPVEKVVEIGSWKSKKTK